MKAVMSSFPIYQFSALLAPASIKKSMAKLIHKFLWQGGKDNEKKFHLINWNIVHAPGEHGGLRVRDSKWVNIALGAKLLSRLVTGNKEWWKQAICRKYLTRNQPRCLDLVPDNKAGSPIWKMLKASLPFFRDSLI